MYPPLSTHIWHSPSVYSSSDGSLSPTLSDDVLTDLPPATMEQDWEILSDLLTNDALNSFPTPLTLQSSQSFELMMQDAAQSSHLAGNAQSQQSEATPASPFSGARPGAGGKTTQGPTRRNVNRDQKGGILDSHLKKEPLSVEEQKKQKRRSQIASSVQRHREKKRCLISSLRTDMVELTNRLATLRAERRAQLADNEQLVAYEEEAMTQRRKRKQAEETNQLLKQALFQQTGFLGGMKTLMREGNMPCFKTLEFHDWVHSYTVLASKDIVARRKEYVAHFPSSKMELAKKLVLKNTEEDFQRMLATGQMYCGNVKILHDGTRDAVELDDGYADVVMQELFGSTGSQSSQSDNAGDGRVIKEFSSVFLFRETSQCTVDTLMDVVFSSMKSIGVYYPGSAYQSRAVDEVHRDEEDGVTKSCVYYSNLAASMQPILEVVDGSHDSGDIKVEARVLTREQRSREEGMILWDYVDEDSLHPMPLAIPQGKTIRRNVCGGMVIRRESGTGLLSVRHVSIKGYCPLSKPKYVTTDVRMPDAEEAQRAVSRGIGLQATEYDRIRDRCMRYIFNALASRLNASQVS